MKDPFEEFLEDAMSGPDDLELGHEMRRRLLEAAVAGETLPADNVVRMDRSEPHEQEGFNWIVGERPATEPLMTRLIQDPGFLAELDGSRCFLRSLREALLKQAEVAVPAARRRFVPAVAMAAAAAISLAAGVMFFNPAGKTAPTVVAQNAPPEKSEASPARPAPATLPTAAPAETAPEIAAAVAESEPDLSTPGPAILPPGSILPEVHEAPAIAAMTGSGQSVEAADPLLAGPAGMALTLNALAANTAMEENASLSLSLTDGGSEPALASMSRDQSSMWNDAGFMSSLPGGSGGLNMSLISNGRESTIPEPGVAAPVLIGMMVLLLRRKRPDTVAH